MKGDFTNQQVGNIWAGWLLAHLAERWPVRCDIAVQHLVNSTGLTTQKDLDEFRAFQGLISWLEDEGYIRYEQINPGGIAEFTTLSQKSFEILRQTPAALNGAKVGDALADAARDIGSEAAKSSLGELFGQIVGGLFKSMGS